MTEMIATRRTVQTARAPRMAALFSQAVIHRDTVYTCGVVGLDPVMMTRPDDFVAEVEQVLDNLGEVLRAAGADYDTVLKTTCFLASPEFYPRFNERYARRFTAPLPARSVVFCSLVGDLRVEIEAVAVVHGLPETD